MIVWGNIKPPESKSKLSTNLFNVRYASPQCVRWRLDRRDSTKNGLFRNCQSLAMLLLLLTFFRKGEPDRIYLVLTGHWDGHGISSSASGKQVGGSDFSQHGKWQNVGRRGRSGAVAGSAELLRLNGWWNEKWWRQSKYYSRHRHLLVSSFGKSLALEARFCRYWSSTKLSWRDLFGTVCMFRSGDCRRFLCILIYVLGSQYRMNERFRCEVLHVISCRILNKYTVRKSDGSIRLFFFITNWGSINYVTKFWVIWSFEE